MGFGLRRRVYWLLGGVVAALALAGGIAYATIPDANGVIHGCRKTGSGLLRVIDADVASCKPGEARLNWNQQGVQGPPGPPGPSAQVDALYANSNAFVQLPGTFRTILSLSLPAGSWLVNGTVNLGNFSGKRVPVLCALSGANSVLSVAGLASFPGAGGDALTLPLSGIADLSSAGTVELQCLSNTGTSAQGFAEGRQMTALRVSSLTIQP